LADLQGKPGFNGLTEDEKLAVFDEFKKEIADELNLSSKNDI